MKILPKPQTAYETHRVSLGGNTYEITYRLNLRENPNRWRIDISLAGVVLVRGRKLLENRLLLRRGEIPELGGNLMVIRNLPVGNPVTKGNIGIGLEYELTYLTDAELSGVVLNQFVESPPRVLPGTLPPTPPPPPQIGISYSPITAKTVVFDIADNYGGTYFSIRAVEFWSNGARLNLTNADFTAEATSISTASYLAEYAFDTNTNKAGSAVGHQWYSDNSGAPQRLLVRFNVEQTFDEIKIMNSHSAGASLDNGSRAMVITTTDQSISDTTYNAAIANGQVLFDGILPKKNITPTQYDDYPIVTDDLSNAQLFENVKSVVIDVADNHGDVSYVGARRFEFFLNNQRVDVTPGTYIAYGNAQSASYVPTHAFDTTIERHGGDKPYQWMAATPGSVRIICVFNTPITFNRIAISNYHIGSTLNTNRGMNNIKITATPDTYTDITYQAAVTNSTTVFEGSVPEYLVPSLSYSDFFYCPVAN